MYQELYIYHVGQQDFSGETPWGDNWTAAQAAAEASGETIYRTVIKTREEVFTGGMFIGRP